jgi:hypothetical protein
MHRKIITGSGMSVVNATFDDGTKKTLTFHGPVDTAKIDEKLKEINKSRGAKDDKPPQDTEAVKLRAENETLQKENDCLRKELEKLKKSDKSEKKDK